MYRGSRARELGTTDILKHAKGSTGKNKPSVIGRYQTIYGFVSHVELYHENTKKMLQSFPFNNMTKFTFRDAMEETSNLALLVTGTVFSEVFKAVHFNVCFYHSI